MPADKHFCIISGLIKNMYWAILIRQVILLWLEIWKNSVWKEQAKNIKGFSCTTAKLSGCLKQTDANSPALLCLRYKVIKLN